MNSITVSENKKLKLRNALSLKVALEAGDVTLFETEILKMKTYIQIHGA